MRFSSFFSYGISLSPAIHCLWSIGLHVCQLCSLAFMSTDVNNKPHSLTWRSHIFLFKLYTAIQGILKHILVILVASTRSESRKLWLLKMTATYNCLDAVFPLDAFLLAPFCRSQWNIQCRTRRGYSPSSADRSMALTDPFAFNTERCDLTWCLRGKRPWPV